MSARVRVCEYVRPSFLSPTHQITGKGRKREENGGKRQKEKQFKAMHFLHMLVAMFKYVRARSALKF